ncbi:MAG: formate dehydrogenase accessory sulfurtransferase FdhD [Armatimonadota bacterium]|nr:formate dehydrogenase accessory sulfurtransferase FdhD [Armatimonadota bacterium]MDR7548772.1 formate dehydrogenase accessory sulfurtransferase FdhD [Armatimonadota bacterium]
MRPRPGSKTRAQVLVVSDGRLAPHPDQVATEEPMEIRVAAGPGGDAGRRTVAVTMRTPGADFELAAGFLFSEGLLRSRDEIRRISYCTDPAVGPDQRYNVVTVELAGTALPDLAPLERHFFTSSACGVCGKAGIEALRVRGCRPVASGPAVEARVLAGLPETLRAAQRGFRATGGLHAAALFDAKGTLVMAKEDVGRHNAMDKLVGWALLEGRVPLDDHLVLVSGRASFELVQKSLAAGIPVFCAVSAPTSLAVGLARDFGMTLVGFLRGSRFNVYAGVERVVAGVPRTVAPARRAGSG